MIERQRTRYVNVRLTELEADMLCRAAIAGEMEVQEAHEHDPDADRRTVARELAALDRATRKLASAKPRTRKKVIT